jgi:hypothetical protein
MHHHIDLSNWWKQIQFYKYSTVFFTLRYILLLSSSGNTMILKWQFLSSATLFSQKHLQTFIILVPNIKGKLCKCLLMTNISYRIHTNFKLLVQVIHCLTEKWVNIYERQPQLWFKIKSVVTCIFSENVLLPVTISGLYITSQLFHRSFFLLSCFL